MDNKHKAAWIVGGATVLAACIGPIFGLVHLPKGAEQKETYSYTGVVRAQDLHPIAGAQILFVQDESAPQSVYSDNNGTFTLTVKNETKHLSLEVHASGFLTFTENAPLHRTGLDDIRLAPTKLKQQSSQPARPPAVSAQRMPVPVDTPSLSPPVQQNCPGGICSNGPITGSPQINNYGTMPPVPRKIRTEAAEAAASYLRGTGSKATLRIDGINDSPEMQEFVQQLEAVFRAGSWTPNLGDLIRKSDFSIDGHTYTPPSISCFSPNLTTLQTLKEALKLSGFACLAAYEPRYPDRIPADAFVRIAGQ